VPERHRKAAHPLAYLLDLMNDPTADPMRRDRAAMAAAKFVHPMPTNETLAGKKAAAEAASRTIDIGTPWERLLRRTN